MDLISTKLGKQSDVVVKYLKLSRQSDTTLPKTIENESHSKQAR